jgi:hypothetical protein
MGTIIIRCACCDTPLFEITPGNQDNEVTSIEALSFPPVILPTNPKELVYEAVCPKCGGKAMIDGSLLGAE